MRSSLSMSPTIETTQPQDGSSALKDALAQHADKMMSLKLSQLKKRAKKNGIPDDAIEAASAGADDEDDTKSVLISLILKAACIKATPSPTRARKPTLTLEEELKAQTCLVCPGCIRPPKHDGSCMDGQCNDIFLPESPKRESGIDVAAEVARHKVVKEETQRKMEEMDRQEAAALEKAKRKAAEEEARCKEEARRKVAQEAQEAEAQKKVEEEEARRKMEQAARQKALAEGVARRKAADEEARRKAAEAAEEEAAQKKAAEEEAAAKKAAEEEAEAEQWRVAVEAAEKEAREKAAEEAAREAARARRKVAEDAAMAEMDERCVETFLDCMTCAWRERIRTPIKGSNLYTKHIRPCRPAGTSVDVKDSGFRSLGNFLQFLEDEGLLRLKPGLSDPVVTEIRLDACHTYKYVARPQCSPSKEAPEDAEYFTPQSSPMKDVSLRPQSSPMSASKMLSFQ